MTSDPTVAAFVSERGALRVTLRQVGPDAPTLAEPWTAADLAAHLIATEQLAGVPTFIGRTLVARFAWRLNDRLGTATQRDVRRFSHRGFEAALEQLERNPPRLLRRPSIAPVSLFEVWTHHEDVRRANDMPIRDTDDAIDLTPSIQWLLRYHRLALDGIPIHVELPDGRALAGEGGGVTIRGRAGESLLWLAGRRAVADVEIGGPPELLARLDPLELRI